MLLADASELEGVLYFAEISVAPSVQLVQIKLTCRSYSAAVVRVLYMW